MLAPWLLVAASIGTGSAADAQSGDVRRGASAATSEATQELTLEAHADVGGGKRSSAELETLDPEAKPSSLTLEDVQRLLARYADEPSALEVARVALRAAEREPDRFASMARRARWRGLVPSLTLGARRGQGLDLRTEVSDEDAVRFTSDDDLVLSATLRFDLGRVLFAGEEVAILREARAARASRLELVKDVIHWYFVRRRLLLERDLTGMTSLSREMRIAELEALLDDFTNGGFSRMIERPRARWTTDANTPASKRP